MPQQVLCRSHCETAARKMPKRRFWNPLKRKKYSAQKERKLLGERMRKSEAPAGFKNKPLLSALPLSEGSADNNHIICTYIIYIYIYILYIYITALHASCIRIQLLFPSYRVRTCGQELVKTNTFQNGAHTYAAHVLRKDDTAVDNGWEIKSNRFLL